MVLTTKYNPGDIVTYIGWGPSLEIVYVACGLCNGNKEIYDTITGERKVCCNCNGKGTKRQINSITPDSEIKQGEIICVSAKEGNAIKEVSYFIFEEFHGIIEVSEDKIISVVESVESLNNDNQLKIDFEND